MKSDAFGLPDALRKNGFLYTLLMRTDKVAMYKQESYDKILSTHTLVGYEVFLITEQRERSFQDRFFPRQERFPSNEDFGKTAWAYSFWAYDRAYARYQSLIQKHQL